MSEQPELYALDPRFEACVLFYCASDAKFWQRAGKELDPACCANPLAKPIWQACYQLAKEGVPPSCLGVMQRLFDQVEDGKLEPEKLGLADALFDSVLALQPKPPEAEAVLAALIPVLKRRLQSKAVVAAHQQWATHGDFSVVQKALARAERLGKTQETPGVRVDEHGFRAIAEVGALERLPTGVFELDQKIGGLWRGALGCWLARSGGGKCHAAGTLLLQPSGRTVRIEEVRVGDSLLGPDGVPRRVLELVRGEAAMYRVSPVRGESWVVNGDHLLTLYVPWQGRLIDVPVLEFLCWPQRRRRLARLVRTGVDFSARSESLPLDPYFLGVFLGNGSTTDRTVRVDTPDPEVVEALRAQACSSGLHLVVRQVKPGCVSYGLAGEGGPNPVSRALAALELRGKTCESKFVPEAYKCGARWVRLAVLAGLIDTDGHYSGRVYDFISKSQQLAEDVAFIARSVGLAASLRPCRKGCQTGVVGTYYRVTLTGHLDSVPCRVARKRAAPRATQRNALHVGFSVTPEPTAAYYGVTIDGDQRYLLGDFTVTHNSMALIHQTATAMLSRRPLTGFVSLELPQSLQLARLYAHLTGVPVNLILDNEKDRTEAQRRVSQIEQQLGMCELAEFPAYGTRPADLDEWVDSKEQEHGVKMDLLVVDYADLLVAPVQGRDVNAYVVMQQVYSGLVALAKRRGMWVWTASQATRGKGTKKTESEYLDLEGVADSMHKSRIADMVISLNPREGGQLELYVAKHRLGRADYAVGPLQSEFDMARLTPWARDLFAW